MRLIELVDHDASQHGPNKGTKKIGLVACLIFIQQEDYSFHNLVYHCTLNFIPYTQWYHHHRAKLEYNIS